MAEGSPGMPISTYSSTKCHNAKTIVLAFTAMKTWRLIHKLFGLVQNMIQVICYQSRIAEKVNTGQWGRVFNPCNSSSKLPKEIYNNLIRVCGLHWTLWQYFPLSFHSTRSNRFSLLSGIAQSVFKGNAQLSCHSMQTSIQATATLSSLLYIVLSESTLFNPYSWYSIDTFLGSSSLFKTDLRPCE
jgi:hypothetical protein